MNILFVGDPHGKLDAIKKIPVRNADLIFVAGDLGKSDFVRKRFFDNIKRKEKNLPELKETSSFVKKSHLEMYDSSIKILEYLSQFAPVYTLFGNAFLSEEERKKNEKEFELKLPSLLKRIKNMKNVFIFSNKVKKFGKIKIAGLEYFKDICWFEEFNIKYFKEIKKSKEDTKKAENFLKKIGKVEILLSHQPPYRILDEVNFKGIPPSWKGKHAGSKILLNYIKKYNPDYVFCGHIHEAKGKFNFNKTKIINLGSHGQYYFLKWP